MDMMFNTEVIVKDMKGGKEDMTENKRFRLGYVCGDYGLIDNDEWIDLHSMSENSEKNVKLCINKMNELAEENEQLKQALREQLEENGNAYCIELLDKIFDLKYDEWQRKMNETHTYDYIDWENVLNDKGDV